MATIKTIKPDGTGDFTTLAAWATFAAAQATADQWAECYGGGNLGSVLLTGWTATPTSVLFPKIYSHSSARHDGTVSVFPPATAAYVDGVNASAAVSVALAFAEVDGLVVRKGRTGSLVTAATGACEYHFHNCLLWRAGTGYVPGANFLDNNTTVTGGFRRFYNNIVYTEATLTAGTFASVLIQDGGGDAALAYNNTVVTNGKHSVGLYLSVTTSASLAYNNAVVGGDVSGMDIFDQQDGDDGSFAHAGTYSNNATSDGREANYGDAAARVASNASFASATNSRPATGSTLIDHGVTIAAVTADAVGTSRPQGSAYDIGAMEFVAELAPGLSAGLTLTGDAASTFVGLMWTRADTGSFHTDYYVYRSPTGSAPWTNVAVILDDTLSFDDTPPTLGTWYYYVHAIDRNDASNTADSSVIQVNTSLSRNRRHGQERGEFFNRNLV